MSQTQLPTQTQPTSRRDTSSRPNVLVDLLKLARPHQWVKNVFVFPALVFGMKMTDGPAVGRVLLAFAAFCLISSAIYVVNDILDRQEDRLHAKKRNRPIAAGRISVRAGILLAIGTLLGGLVLSNLAGVGTGAHRGVLMIGITYVVLMLAYNLSLKHHVILDVMTIAIGFLLRAVAGAMAADVEISPWLLVCTFTLCLFLGFGKRQCELGAFASAAEAANHRSTLIHYTPYLLSHLLTISAGIAVLTFLFYALDPQTRQKFHFHGNLLIYTTPLVFYGIFRYTMLVQSGRVGGPNEVLLADRPFLVTVAAWALLAVAIVYWGGPIEEAFRFVMGQSPTSQPVPPQ